MSIAKEVQSVIDKYEKVKPQRLQKISDFHTQVRPFLVCLAGPNTVCHGCNTIEESFDANIDAFNKGLDLPSDTLGFLEPWFGTGAYAEAFGCKYAWRDDEGPACHYKYHKIEEVRDIQKPDISQGEIFKMVLDAIDYFKDRTDGRLPISLTDTQSAHDTASLVLDATEVFTAAYTAPDILERFLAVINELIIDFSKAQIDAIGDVLVGPGHIMTNSIIGGKGISLSDDNLAVNSPPLSEKFLLPLDDKLGEVFGGVAIHSCGVWTHTMPMVIKMKNIVMIDCAISTQADPTPNQPEKIRDIFKGSDIIVQVRGGDDTDQTVDLLKKLHAPDLRLIVKVPARQDDPQKQYDTITGLLEQLYA